MEKVVIFKENGRYKAEIDGSGTDENKVGEYPLTEDVDILNEFLFKGVVDFCDLMNNEKTEISTLPDRKKLREMGYFSYMI